MMVLGSFAGPLLMVLVQGGIAFAIFRQCASRKAAAIATFWLCVGTAGGRHSFSAGPDDDLAPALAAVAGAGLGLFLLWRWLLKRPETESVDDEA